VPVGAERSERFRRLLDEPLVPSVLRADEGYLAAGG
jgi:hypothetical protein